MESRAATGYRRGVWVFVALAVLTVLEFFAANLGSAAVMFIIALVKAAIIVNYFMHIYRLWREESH